MVCVVVLNLDASLDVLQSFLDIIEKDLFQAHMKGYAILISYPSGSTSVYVFQTPVCEWLHLVGEN